MFNYLTRKYKLPSIPKNEFKKLYKSNKLGGVILDVKQKFLPEFLKIYHSFKGSNEKPFNGVKRALKKLKEHGYIIGVITGRIIKPQEIRDELSLYDINNYIDEVFTNPPVDLKTNSEPPLLKTVNIKSFLNQYRASPKQCVVVGDYVADITSGKMVGCWTIAVLTGGTDYEILEKEKPDKIINSVGDIPFILKI